MDKVILNILKDYVEGRLLQADWQAWLAEHAAEIEGTCDRRKFLRLKHQAFKGAAAVLEQNGISFKLAADHCQHCGQPLFTAMPGKTTFEEIQAYEEGSKITGWEEIIRDRWIHPGQYCPNGCTTILWELKRDSDDNGSAKNST